MKKSTKITLWVLGAIVILLVALFLSADIIISRVVHKEVSNALVYMPGAEANVGKVYVNLISGSAIVKDITFSTNHMSLEDTVSGARTPGLAVHIPSIAIWNVRYRALIREQRLRIANITINDPHVLVYLDEQNPGAIMPLPNLPKDTTLEKAHQWLQSVELRSFNLNNLCASMRSTRTPLHLVADSLSLETKQIAYNTVDTTVSYNDSVYSFLLKTLRVETPDSLLAVETHDIHTEDQGPLSIGYTRLRNIITPKALADLNREPTTWIDLELNSVSTCAINPIHKALQNDYNLDSIHADVKRMHVFRDERYKPKRPFDTPQEFLRQVPVQFCVKYVNAVARKVDIEFATTDINCGKLHVQNIHTRLTNVTNRPGAVWMSHATAPFGKQGKVDASLAMHMDKASTFELKLEAKDAETDDLNPFIRPLVGITSHCHINQLDATYKGDKVEAKGEFCMQYHGLEVQVHKEDKIPYEIVTKHADMFTSLANTLVTKSNPSSVDIEPRSYMVEWKRDEWKPYPLYLFGPCIDGVVKTMLPGLFVHKQTHHIVKAK